MKHTNQLIGCCGLDCETCDARIATITNDTALREKTAALWSKLNGVPITPDMMSSLWYFPMRYGFDEATMMLSALTMLISVQIKGVILSTMGCMFFVLTQEASAL